MFQKIKHGNKIYSGCNDTGIYSKNCDKPCPSHCKDNTCQIQSGNCFECSPGWIGTFCSNGNIFKKSYFYSFSIVL